MSVVILKALLWGSSWSYLVKIKQKLDSQLLRAENDAILTSMNAKPNTFTPEHNNLLSYLLIYLLTSKNTFTPVTQRNEVTKSLNNSLRDSSVVALPLNDEIIIYSLLTNPTFTPENDAMLTCMHAKPNTFTPGGVLC